jgi:hypothetical protein
MTEAWIFVNGQKVQIPQHPYQAREFRWHLGAEYNSALEWENPEFDNIKTWCEQTCVPHTYRMFLRSVWFFRESDALLCKLRWV